MTDTAEDWQRLYPIDLHDGLPDAERIQALAADARRFKFERDHAHAATERVMTNWKRAEAGDKATLQRVWGLVDHKRKTLPMADLYAALQGEQQQSASGSASGVVTGPADTAFVLLRAWLARYDANDEAAARGRPFKWDADGNVTATSHNFDSVIPPMDVDEVEAVSAVLDEREQLAALAQLAALLGIGVDRKEWDAIAEAEGRRYEAEQTNGTIVGYLAYRYEDMKAQRHILLSETKELEAERETDVRAVAEVIAASGGTWMATEGAILQLARRFADRFAALGQRDDAADGSAR